MAEARRRRAFLDRPEGAPQIRRHRAEAWWALPVAVLGGVFLGASVLIVGNVFVIGIFACVVGIALADLIAPRRGNTAGILAGLFADGWIETFSQRRAMWSGVLMTIASGLGGAVWGVSLMAGGAPDNRWYAAFGPLAAAGVVAGIWRVVAGIRSVNVRVDARGVTVTGPLRADRRFVWEELAVASGTTHSIDLTLVDGSAVRLPAAWLESDPIVVAELIEICRAFPDARRRVGFGLLQEVLDERGELFSEPRP